MSKLDDAILLPILPIEDVRECREIAKKAAKAQTWSSVPLDKRYTNFYDGFTNERKVGYYGDQLDPGLNALASCLDQQFRGAARVGPDLLDIDVKSSQSRGNLEAAFKSMHMNVEVKAVREDGKPKASRFALVIVENGNSYLVGWMTREDVSSFKTDDEGRYHKVPIAKLKSPKTLFKKPSRKAA